MSAGAVGGHSLGGSGLRLPAFPSPGRCLSPRPPRSYPALASQLRFRGTRAWGRGRNESGSAVLGPLQRQAGRPAQAWGRARPGNRLIPQAQAMRTGAPRQPGSCGPDSRSRAGPTSASGEKRGIRLVALALAFPRRPLLVSCGSARDSRRRPGVTSLDRLLLRLHKPQGARAGVPGPEPCRSTPNICALPTPSGCFLH